MTPAPNQPVAARTTFGNSGTAQWHAELSTLVNAGTLSGFALLTVKGVAEPVVGPLEEAFVSLDRSRCMHTWLHGLAPRSMRLWLCCMQGTAAGTAAGAALPSSVSQFLSLFQSADADTLSFELLGEAAMQQAITCIQLSGLGHVVRYCLLTAVLVCTAHHVMQWNCARS